MWLITMFVMFLLNSSNLALKEKNLVTVQSLLPTVDMPQCLKLQIL